jgi:hypothetical protein
MKNDQEHRTYSKANPHTAPKPVTPRLCLIILGHRAILLPPRRRAKSKWGRAAVAGVGDPGWVGWWRHPRGGEINGMNFALVSTVNQKAFRLINARDDSDFFENPLRVERSRGPLRRTPAKRINFFDDLPRDLRWQKCMRPMLSNQRWNTESQLWAQPIEQHGQSSRPREIAPGSSRPCRREKNAKAKRVRVNGERTGSA